VKKRSLYLVTVAAVLGFAVAGTALAHGWRGPGAKGAFGLERMAAELELNDYQQGKLEAVKQAMRESRRAARAGFAERRQSMLGLIDQPTFDRAGAQALLEQSARAMTERGTRVIEAVAEFYDSLAPDQQQKLRAALSERMERFSHRRGARGRGGS
jgi:Spy/CpxP family protein refolding chaperone